MKLGPLDSISKPTLAFCLLFASFVLASAADYFVSDQTGVINRISSAGVVTTYATFPGSSDLPEGLALDAGGTLYIANAGQGLLWKIPPGGTLTPFADTGNQIYSYGLTLGPNGNLFAAVSGVNVGRIDELTPTGIGSVFVSLPAGAEPFGLAFDKGGNLFVSDAQHKNVYRITPAGMLSLFASLPLSLFPTGLAFDDSDNLFVADFGGSIYKITAGGNISTYVTLPSTAGLKGLLYDDGSLYFAEQNRNVIGKISAGPGLTDVVISDFAQMHAPQFLVAIPEPSSFALVGLELLVLYADRRAHQKQPETPVR